ncbi:hypothetical protein JW964_11250 [candidate division KSB1 bacterium]|nr:hypothetical protein [candidate division KSB1 bacterium]
MSTNMNLKPTSQANYLTLILNAATEMKQNYDAELDTWRLKFDAASVLGQGFPHFIFRSATFEAFLFDRTGEKQHAEQAKKALLELQNLEKWFPTAFGPNRQKDRYGFWKRVPAVPPEAYFYLKGKGILTSDEEKLIEKWLAEYAESYFALHEWGGHNRALWATRDLARIITLLPKHSENAKWKKLCLHLLKTSWGNWSIEDAQIYLPLWLSKMMHIADILNIPDLFKEYNMLYYLNYFLNLLAPHGMVTDYGDARWQECWHWYLTCFERGAKEYHNEEFKWAAARIFETKAKNAAPSEIDIDFPFLCECTNDLIGLKQPTTGSRMVMDELVGKKIVFRNGWNPESTFLMLNYKGDQDYGRCDRDYLRTTINVPAEKMHHGHADENSICLLMSHNSVLLNDAGYRETSTNGMYRADFYHNRLVFRNEAPEPLEPVMNSLHKRSWYQPTETEKIHFFNFKKWDYSRTRVRSAEEGWEWDRSIIYLKAQDSFLLFDTVKVLKDCYLNINNIFHGQQVLNFGETWFDTRFNQFYDWKNPGDRRLLIWFKPQAEMKINVAELLRNKTVNTAVFQYIAREFQKGEFVNFTTVLTPHDRGENLAEKIKSYQSLETSVDSAALGLSIQCPESIIHICLKANLALDFFAAQIRPRYNYETGKVKYGDLIETDARFLIIEEKRQENHYGFVEGVKIMFKNQLLFEVPSHQPSLHHPNGEFYHPAQPKWDWWED